MTMARSHLVDVSLTRWYHCITRCVSTPFYCRTARAKTHLTANNGSSVDWKNLRIFSRCRSAAFRCMDNHLHVLVRLDPDVATNWTDEEVVRRGAAFPPRDKSRQPLPVSDDWIEWRLKDAQWVATAPRCKMGSEIR